MAKQKTDSVEFVNPFESGVDYKTFLDACGGKSNVASYCEGKLSKEQIEWLENDLTHFNY